MSQIPQESGVYIVQQDLCLGHVPNRARSPNSSSCRANCSAETSANQPAEGGGSLLARPVVERQAPWRMPAPTPVQKLVPPPVRSPDITRWPEPPHTSPPKPVLPRLQSLVTTLPPKPRLTSLPTSMAACVEKAVETSLAKPGLTDGPKLDQSYGTLEK